MTDTKFELLLEFLSDIIDKVRSSDEFRHQVLAKLDELKGEVMALSTAEAAIVKRFDDATTAISNKIDALIAAGTSSPEFLTNLQAIADSLDNLGKTGTPVPGPGPQPV